MFSFYFFPGFPPGLFYILVPAVSMEQLEDNESAVEVSRRSLPVLGRAKYLRISLVFSIRDHRAIDRNLV